MTEVDDWELLFPQGRMIAEQMNDLGEGHCKGESHTHDTGWVNPYLVHTNGQPKLDVEHCVCKIEAGCAMEMHPNTSMCSRKLHKTVWSCQKDMQKSKHQLDKISVKQYCLQEDCAIYIIKFRCKNRLCS